jgi:predicted hotdog family 3-hydroxylacyl-ACP dehydratase
MYSLSELLPQKEPMILLSGYREGGGAFVKITKDDIFFDEALGGTPIIAGLEYMAQAIAMTATLESKRIDPANKARIGFLLGTRSYKAYIDRFYLGEIYDIVVSSLFVDEEAFSFGCEITDQSGKKCAEAILNVFKPKDESRFK